MDAVMPDAYHAIADQFEGWSLGWVRSRLAVCLLRAVVHRPALQHDAILLELAEHVVGHLVDQQYPRRIQAALPQRRQLTLLVHRQLMSGYVCKNYRRHRAKDSEICDSRSGPSGA